MVRIAHGFGSEGISRQQNSICAIPLLYERKTEHGRVVQEARIIREEHYDRDVYRVILKKGDTLPFALDLLHKFLPNATLEHLVSENNLSGETLQGEHPYSSLTYTIPVIPKESSHVH